MNEFPRRTGVASVATLAAFTMAFGLVHAIAPQWSHAAGLDVWNFASEADECQSERVRHEQLVELQEIMSRQAAASGPVVAHLVDGRITLAEATDEMEAITRDRPGFTDLMKFVYPSGPTHRARIARYTIGKVRTLLVNNPSRLAEVSSRLETEYRHLNGE